MDMFKPITLVIKEMDRGLNKSRWSWQVYSTRGGVKNSLFSGVSDSFEEAAINLVAAGKKVSGSR